MHIETQIARVKKLKEQYQVSNPKDMTEKEARLLKEKLNQEHLKHPCFILAHEFYDALPIH